MYDVVKHFSSKIRNRKNYNGMLDTNLYFPRNQLQQDHNGARIVTACELLKSALRIKTGTQVHYKHYKIQIFLTETEWRTVG